MIFGRTYDQQLEYEQKSLEYRYKHACKWKIKFAFLPVQLESGKYLWLERYVERFKGNRETWDAYIDISFYVQMLERKRYKDYRNEQ